MSDCGCVDTTPCNSQDCGCKFEVDASCVRYTNADLTCIGATKGDILEKILQNINSKLCDLVQGTYLQTSVEPAGVNCSAGGTKLVVRNVNTDEVISTDYVCSASVATNGYATISAYGSSLSVTLTDIPGPVTYQWSFADSSEQFTFTSATDIASPTVTRNEASSPFSLVPPFGIINVSKWSTLVKVVILDVLGNYHTAYYQHNYTLSLYE
jgi:hypothetical protein